MQLNHDAEQKDRDRKATLRREVYLRAAEELVKANVILSSLPQVDITQTNIAQELQGFFVASSQLALISELQTAYLTNKLTTLYGELALKLAAKIMPIYSLKTDIRFLDEDYNRTQTEIQRILNEMRHMNESGSVDQARLQVLQRSFDSQMAQAKEIATE